MSARAWSWAAAAPALLVAVAGPAIAGDPEAVVGVPFTATGLLGTDRLGRDVLTRLLSGGLDLLVLPLAATVLATVAGLTLGLLAGYLSGWWDHALQAVLDTVLAVPAVLVLLLLLSAATGRTSVLLIGVLLTGTPYVTKVARAAAVRSYASGYVEQAMALGESPGRIMAVQVLPNVLGPVLTEAGTRLVAAVELAAAAGFLGFGLGATDWASMVNDNLAGITLAPWSVLAPALLLAGLVVPVAVALATTGRRAAS